MEETIFLCNSDLHRHVASFIVALQSLASQSKAKLKNLFPDIETTIKIKLDNIIEKLTQRHNRRKHARCDMIRMIVITKFLPPLNFYRYKKIKKVIFKNLWKVVATVVWFQQCKKQSQLNQILFATHSC